MLSNMPRLRLPCRPCLRRCTEVGGHGIRGAAKELDVVAGHEDPKINDWGYDM